MAARLFLLGRAGLTGGQGFPRLAVIDADHLRSGRQVGVESLADDVLYRPAGHRGIDPQPVPQGGFQPRCELDFHGPSWSIRVLAVVLENNLTYIVPPCKQGVKLAEP